MCCLPSAGAHQPVEAGLCLGKQHWESRSIASSSSAGPGSASCPWRNPVCVHRLGMLWKINKVMPGQPLLEMHLMLSVLSSLKKAH